MENDKLPALAGLARSMAERTGDFYQAGLWKSMLPELFWKVAMSEPTHMCKDPGHDKLLLPPWKSEVVVPPAYRAPSWSWAWVDASVEFGWLRSEGPLTEILERRVELAGSDTFGRVKSGYIKIKAPLIETHSNLDITRNKAKFCYESHNSKTQGTAFFGFDPQFPCNALFLSPESALLLRSGTDEGTHIWIGVVNWYPERTIRTNVEMRSICSVEEDSVDIRADRTTWQVVTIV